MSLRLTLLAPADAAARFGPAWDALGTPAGQNGLFTSRQWTSAWCHSFGQTTSQTVIIAEDDAGLLALMPTMCGKVRRGPALSVRFDFRPGDDAFMRTASRTRVLRLGQVSPIMGAESHNTRGGWRIRTGAETSGIAGLVAGLRKLRGWSYALLPILESEIDRWAEALQAAGLRTLVRKGHRRFLSRTQIIPWRDFVAAQSRNLRKNVKRSDERAASAGVSVQTHVGARAMAALPAFFSVADASWKSRGRDGEEIVVPLTDGARAFYRDLFSSDGVVPLLVMATIGDRAVAGQLWTAHGPALYGMSTFHHPEVAELGPSRLLMAQAFDWAAENRIQSIDFNSTHDWCKPYADREDEMHQLLVFETGLVGPALYALAHRFNRNDLVR